MPTLGKYQAHTPHADQPHHAHMVGPVPQYRIVSPPLEKAQANWPNVGKGTTLLFIVQVSLKMDSKRGKEKGKELARN